MLLLFKYLLPVFLVSWALGFLFIKFPPRRLQDKSSERSLHKGVIPRSGGIAIFIALASGWLICFSQIQDFFSIHIMIAVFLMCGIALLDDFFSLSPLLRFISQLMIAGFIVFVEQLYFKLDIAVPMFIFQCITLIGLVWMINLYNFMDGMDGFASGMAMIGFGSLAGLGFLKGDHDYGLLNALVVAATGGFWIWNFPPARIFMGDCGSVLLGTLAGIVSLVGVNKGLFPLWVPALVFSPFWVDATYTLLRRIIRKEPFWLPHRSHIYQRLAIYQGGHRPVVLAAYGLMLACSLTACLPPVFGLDYNGCAPFVWAALYLALILVLESRLKK